MEALGFKASLEANESFSGTAEQALMKRVLDKGKAVDDKIHSKLPSTTLALVMEKQVQKHHGPDQGKGKASKIDPNPEKEETEPSFSLFLHPKKGQVAESSKVAPTLTPPARPPVVCKFCGQQFSSTQALGGHQNAHKREREMQRVMKAVQEFGKNPFMYSFLRPPFFPGSYYGYNFQNPSYAPREWHARPNTTGLGLGLPTVGWAPEGFVGPSAMRPTGTACNSGGARPPTQALGTVNGSLGSTKFDSHFNTSLQAKNNEDRPNKKQCIEHMGLGLSLKCIEFANPDLPSKCTESAEQETPEKQNESADFDLTLKL